MAKDVTKEVVVEQEVKTVVTEGAEPLNPANVQADPQKTVKLDNGTVRSDY
jgi:hypothetical protein